MEKKQGARIDSRVERSKQRVLGETCNLLVEAGLSHVSVDEIARRSGVSKTTIYRHWPSRNALLVDACHQLGSTPEVPNTGSLRKDVQRLVAHFADQLQHARWPAVLPSILDAAERDPELARLHWEMALEIYSPFFEVMKIAKGRGELSNDQDEDQLLEALLAPLFFRRYHSKARISEAFLTQVVEKALR